MRYCPQCGESTSALHCTDDGTPTVRRVTNATGRVKRGEVIGGRYRVNGVIGRGGFGTVYEADHVTTGHAVAVKLLAQHPGVEGDELARRFFKEAATTARLSHPNTVRVFDFGQTEGGDLFIAMERLVGESLQERITRNHERGEVMTGAQAVEVGVAVLRSLAEAHAHGLVHRDLKPANIFLHQVAGGDSIVKVLDFGIVKDVDTTITQAGKALGTPTHMSPEQAMGKAVDPRCDLYSLGCVLFECLVGTLPFFADTPLAMVMQHVIEPVPSIEERVPGLVRPEIAAVVERALAKEPADRWDDANTMRTALQQALSALGSGAFPLNIQHQRRESVLGGTVPGVSLPQAPPPSTPATEPRVESVPAAPSSAKPSMRIRLPAAADGTQTPVHADDRTVVERPAMLDTPSGPIPVLKHLRAQDGVGQASDGRRAVAAVAQAQTPAPPVRASSLRAFPGSEAAPPPPPPPPPPPRARFAERATVHLDVADAQQAERLRRAAPVIAISSPNVPIPNLSPSLSPSLGNSSEAAAPSPPSVRLNPEKSSSKPSSPRRIAPSPRPFSIAGEEDVQVQRHAHVARPVPPAPTDTRGLGGLGARRSANLSAVMSAFRDSVGQRSGLPDGMAQLAAGMAGSAGLGNALNAGQMQARMGQDLMRMTQGLRHRANHHANHHASHRTSGEHSAIAAMWIGEDGGTVLYGDRAGNVRMVHDVGIEDRPIRLSSLPDCIEMGAHKAMISALAMTPDGRLLLTAAVDGSVKLWAPSAGRELASLELEVTVNTLGVSVDGKLALVGCDDGTARLLELPTLRERRSLRGHRDTVTAVAIAGSRRAVVTAGSGGTVRTWDPVGGGARLTTRGHDGAVASIALDRRGKWILSGGWDGKARLWSPRTGDTRHAIDAHQDVVAGVALDPSGAYFATVGDDRAARIWDLESGVLVVERTDFETGAKYVRFSADGRCIYVGAWDGSVRRLRVPG